jgi:hypothetical protein
MFGSTSDLLRNQLNDTHVCPISQTLHKMYEEENTQWCEGKQYGTSIKSPYEDWNIG